MGSILGRFLRPERPEKRFGHIISRDVPNTRGRYKLGVAFDVESCVYRAIFHGTSLFFAKLPAANFSLDFFLQSTNRLFVCWNGNLGWREKSHCPPKKPGLLFPGQIFSILLPLGDKNLSKKSQIFKNNFIQK